MAIELKKRESLDKRAEELKKAFLTGGDGTPVNFRWKEDQAQEFIDFIIDESAGMLSRLRIVPMSAPTKEIAKIVDQGRFLKPGGQYKRTGGRGGDIEGYKFGTNKLMLAAKKAEGLIYISDDEMRDNIEGDNWEAHAKRMVAAKIANELVEAAIYGRKLQNPSGLNGILNLFDGIKWLVEEMGNVLDAEGEEIARKHILKAKKTLKTKYRNQVSVLMDSDIKTDFDELYNDPNGNRGDGDTVKNRVSGMPILEIPLMKSDNPVITAVSTTTNGITSDGQKTIAVNDNITANLVSGDSITVREGLADEMTYTVNTVAAGAITTVENIIYEIPASSTVHKVTLT